MTTENLTPKTKSSQKARRARPRKTAQAVVVAPETASGEIVVAAQDAPVTAAPVARPSRRISARPRVSAAKAEPARKSATKKKRTATKPSERAVADQSAGAAKKAAPGRAKKAAVVVKVKEIPQVIVHGKVVRDGFTMPKNEYEALRTLKSACLKKGLAVKKSELLRAGLKILAGMPIDGLIKAIAGLPVVKTGRKKKS